MTVDMATILDRAAARSHETATGCWEFVCRNRACWNPEHLDAVPRGLNVLRGNAPTIVAYREGRCLAGHPATDMYESKGKRQCAVCARATARRRWHAKKGQS